MQGVFFAITLKPIKMIPSVEEMISRYVAAWNNASLPEFKVAFAECWATDATYTDPSISGLKGVDEIAALAQESLEKFPGRTFDVLTQPEHHHNCGRYTWKANFADGSSREGFDFFEFTAENKISRIVSFF